jgi:hypothetical protein
MEPQTPVLLGRLAAELHDPPAAGAFRIASSRAIGRGGRKLLSSSARHGFDGGVLACARAT